MIATNASDTFMKAPMTELATTELTRVQPNHLRYKGGEVAAGNAADICRQERQSGEHGDVP